MFLAPDFACYHILILILRSNIFSMRFFTFRPAVADAITPKMVVKNVFRPSKGFGIAIALVANLYLLTSVQGQTTYTWNQTGTASWATAANWAPNRTTPAATDILVFNNGATTTPTSIPTQTIGQLLVSGNTTVNLQAAAANTLTIGGGAGTDLSVASGSQLNINGTNALALSLSTGATGSITGNMTFTIAAHRLTAVDASAITFQSGSTSTAGAGFGGNPFGTTGLNSIVFASGSIFAQIAGANPFGASAPNSVVVFQTGSLFKLNGSIGPSFSGRTYANFEYNAGATQSVNGGSALSIDNLTVTSGTFNIGMTGTFNLKGNISVASGATLSFNPSSTATVTFNGTSNQSVTNAGTLTFLSNQSVAIANSNT
ncbi:MAG: hypothetical protein LH618_13385, partial [Saprospiraceae bacterium]|nr:hypothetical protein [Saprospiraceae bacterium]